jgi:hypothetical protein
VGSKLAENSRKKIQNKNSPKKRFILSKQGKDAQDGQPPRAPAHPSAFARKNIFPKPPERNRRSRLCAIDKDWL